MKTGDMPICDRSIQVLAEEEGGRFRVEAWSRNKPKLVILRAIYRLQPKPADFSANLDGDSIKDSTYPPCNLSVTAEIGPFSGKFEWKLAGLSQAVRERSGHEAPRRFRLPSARRRGRKLAESTSTATRWMERSELKIANPKWIDTSQTCWP